MSYYTYEELTLHDSCMWEENLFLESYHTYKESKPSDYLAVFSCNKSAQIQKRGANYLPQRRNFPNYGTKSY